jgi:hypothetical protein
MSWKTKPRHPIELGEDDVCFDDFVTSLSHPRTYSGQSSRNRSALDHTSSSGGNGLLELSNSADGCGPRDECATAQIEQLVFQHQSLIDQLLIELALEREARIALEDRVSFLEQQQKQRTSLVTEPPKESMEPPRKATRVFPPRVSTSTLRSVADVRGTDASPPRRGWGTVEQVVPPS